MAQGNAVHILPSLSRPEEHNGFVPQMNLSSSVRVEISESTPEDRIVEVSASSILPLRN